MKYSFEKFLENRKPADDLYPEPLPEPLPELPNHLKIGDHVMVSPASGRYRKASPVNKNIFKKTYGTIIEYPTEGNMRGKVKAYFKLHKADGTTQELTYWFSIPDLFIRPKHLEHLSKW